MSPRKSRLDSALDDLRYLPRVLKALEVLNGEQEKVRALMRGGTDAADAVDRHAGLLYQLRTHPSLAPVPTAATPGDPLAIAEKERAWQAQRSATLDTPERREYEAAKKAGSVVPDPFAGISPAQRERMEEQRALVERLKTSRGGTPAPGGPSGHPMGAPSLAEVAQLVGTEELEHSANGSAGAEVQSGGFTDG